MNRTPVKIVGKLLDNPISQRVVDEQMAGDATYINQNYVNKEQQRIRSYRSVA
jgi:hypothetical protein